MAAVSTFTMVTPAREDYDEDSIDSLYDFLSECVAQWGTASPEPMMAATQTYACDLDMACLELIQAYDSEEWEESEIEGDDDEREVDEHMSGFLTDLLQE
jgi:hypothetical protein